MVGKDAGDDAVMKIARLKTGRCVKAALGILAYITGTSGFGTTFPRENNRDLFEGICGRGLR